jgi:hypothetical protein
MRKKQVPAHDRKDVQRKTREREPEARLEDDGFVFWPESLGETKGPRLVQVERKAHPKPSGPPRRRRLSTTILFAVLFFAGAALTAAAGNEVATIVSPSSPSDAPLAVGADTTATDTTATDTTVTDTTATATTTTDVTTTDAATTEATTTEPADTTTVPADPATTETTGGGDTTTTTVEGPADDQPSGDGDGTTPVTTTPAPTTVPPAAPAATLPAPVSAPAPTATGGSASGSGSAPVQAPNRQPKANPKPVPVLAPPATTSPSAKRRKSANRPDAAYASPRTAPKPRDVEHESTPGIEVGSVQWIDQPLPDPTPPSMRLSKDFARQLEETSSGQGLDWAFLLAVLRAEHLNSSGEVSTSELQKEAATLGALHVGANDRQTLLAYKQDDGFADRVTVLDHYYKAIGLKTLVAGLASSRDRLAAKVLSDPRIDIYPGGRDDISSGRVDVRVVAMIAFLAESFGDVRVSCLITGHRLYARPGVISAHIYGRAVDIAALDDIPIYGHQQLESVTERAIKQILLLPAEMMPKQVISLLGLGGPSFPLADHTDHIHIGY